jgi:hypothetical protein
MAAGDHRERASPESALKVSDQLLEKAATKGAVVVQPWPRRVAEAGPIGDDAAAGLEMMGESSQFIPGRDRAQRW